MWFAIDPGSTIRLGNDVPIWLWTALPGMVRRSFACRPVVQRGRAQVILVFLVCTLIENAFLSGVRVLFPKPTYFVVLVLAELRSYLRLVMFTASLDRDPCVRHCRRQTR